MNRRALLAAAPACAVFEPTDGTAEARTPPVGEMTISEFMELWDRLSLEEKSAVVTSVRAANSSQAREVTP